MESDPAVPSSAELVRALAGPKGQFEAYRALVGRGDAALPAIRAGLKSENWAVRYWCAVCLDQIADVEALRDLVPLIRDPHSKVRLWAVHSTACDHCKADARCPVDLVPLLVERLECDESIRVRRMAAIMLGTEFQDARVVPALERVLATDDDRKLRLHAERGLRRLRSSELAPPAAGVSGDRP